MRKTILMYIFILSVFAIFFAPSISNAQPYGTGLYGANVPYGGQTSLSITTNGNVTIPINPTSDGSISTGSSTITVTSTDVVGFKLYIRALSDTNMNNSGTLLPASANGSPAALAINTWGYNVDASSNYTGITLSDVLIKSLTGPAKSGDVTTVTYGMNIDLTKKTGNYSTNVIYTAVPQTN